MLGLHSSSVLAAEAQLSNGYIIKDDVEVFGSLKQLPADQQGHLDKNTEQQCSTTSYRYRLNLWQALRQWFVVLVYWIALISEVFGRLSDTVLTPSIIIHLTILLVVLDNAETVDCYFS